MDLLEIDLFEMVYLGVDELRNSAVGCHLFHDQVLVDAVLLLYEEVASGGLSRNHNSAHEIYHSWHQKDFYYGHFPGPFVSDGHYL